MTSNNLEKYLKTHLKRGYTQATINKHLLEWGYTQKEIDSAKPTPTPTKQPSKKFFSFTREPDPKKALKLTYFLLVTIATSHITIAHTQSPNLPLLTTTLQGLLSATLFILHYIAFAALLCAALTEIQNKLFKQTAAFGSHLALFIYTSPLYLLLGVIEPLPTYHTINGAGASIGLLHLNASMLISLVVFSLATKHNQGLSTLQTHLQITLPLIVILALLVLTTQSIAQFHLLSAAIQAF